MRREKNKKWTTCSDALGDVLRRLGFHKKINQYKLWEIWDRVVGPQIAQNARPSRWQGNTLIVTVKHASWMQELSFLNEQLVGKIKEAVPGINISGIRFEIGKVD